MSSQRSTSTTGNTTASSLPAGPVASTVAVPAGVQRMTSQALFSGMSEVEIMHNGFRYRLRQTALGKLILTK